MTARERSCRGGEERADKLRTCQSGHAPECSTSLVTNAPSRALPTLRFGPCIGRAAALRLASSSPSLPGAGFSSRRRLQARSKPRFQPSPIVRRRRRSSMMPSRSRRKILRNRRDSAADCSMSTATVCSKWRANRIRCFVPSRTKQSDCSSRRQPCWSASARVSRALQRSCWPKMAHSRRPRVVV